MCASLQPGIADFMSRLDSVHYEVRSAKVDGLVTSSKIFAKYGARDVETGPIQLLKSKLLRYLRPFNPGKHPATLPQVVEVYI